MRYIKDITHQKFKISIYHWNNKYIIKVENGLYEQTYKIMEYEVTNVEELEKSIDQSFLNSIDKRFEEMNGDFMESLLRNEIIF